MPMARTNVRVSDCGTRSAEDNEAIGPATRLITRVCQLAGSSAFIDEARASLEAEGVAAAVRDRNTPALFDWRYCSQQGLDICNGNKIDDRARCENKDCELYSNCDRIRLSYGK